MLMRPTRVAAVICHALSPELSHDAYGFTASFLDWPAPRAAIASPGSGGSRPAASASVRNTSCLPWPGFGHVSRPLHHEGGPNASEHDRFHGVSAGPINAN